MAAERQTSWGRLTATSTFLEGACGAVFFISFTLDVLNTYTAIAKIGLVLGPVLGILGAFALVADLSVPRNFYRVFLNLSTSWMSRGALLMVMVVVFGLGYSLLPFSPWNEAAAFGKAIGIIAAASAFLLMIYPGFFFSRAKSIPLWSSSVLVAVFLFTALLSGIGILLLIAASFVLTLGGEMVGALNALGTAGIILILLQLVNLWGYIEVGSFGTAASTGSAYRLLRTPLFIGGAIIIGLAMPLLMLIYGAFASDALVLTILSEVAGALLVIGAVSLRHAVLKAGLYIPLYPI